ncbi:hypothetical protein CATRI_07610 [Corynebacterium atrinae]|nr:hypothetical protein CATRI_07610 [Corynebacterium atrinae]
MTIRAIKLAAVATSVSLALVACSNSTDTATVTSEAPTQPASTAPAVAGEDPVIAAIDAVLTAHSGGIIVSIDRDNRGGHYDIDVVVGDEIFDLTVDSAGNVTEDDRESDRDDVIKAQNATLTAEDAIRQALIQHPDGVLDDADLDEENGRLQWEVNLDDQSGNDLAELKIAAN